MGVSCRGTPSVTVERLRRAFLWEPADAQGRATLDPEESHHLVRVLRVRPGDAIAVFDGRGGEWEARVVDAARDRVTVSVGAPRAGAVEPNVRVLLDQALARPERIEWVLQKGTEVGIAAFRLVPAVRAEAPLPSPSRLERYRRVVLEACKQSGRRVLPAVEVGPFGEPPSDGLAVLLDPDPSARPLAALLEGATRRHVRLAVGPEGGFDRREAADLEGRGFLRARLGPRVLRTETAGAIAAAIVLFAWGDLGLR